jgi:molybdate transport system substrate-binding protein
VKAAPKVDGVVIPAASNVKATYPVAVVKATTNASAANAFVSFLRSNDGQAILARYGFEQP